MIFGIRHYIIILQFYTIFSDVSVQQKDKSKGLNVVIFFAHVDPKCFALKEDTLGFLNLHETTRVKHNSEDNLSLAHAGKYGSIYCKDLLKNSLMTLTHYCHSILKMRTAVASVSSKETTNDIQEPEAPFHESSIGALEEVPSKTRRSILNKNDDKTKSEEEAMSSAEDNTRNTGKNIITSTKHTEVFKIRVKRQDNQDDQKNIQVKISNHVPSGPTNTKPSWDVLDIMKHVRYSFLGKIFQNTLKNQVKADQQDLVDLQQIGKEKVDYGLFNMVKTTLTALQEPPETNFLMVIFGGHLHTVKDKHSAIVQSVKHIIETTEAENTLIIVTGSCTTDKMAKNYHGGNGNSRQYIPVYAKGPKSDVLKECTLLYDVPLTVKKILENYTETDVHFPGPISR